MNTKYCIYCSSLFREVNSSSIIERYNFEYTCWETYKFSPPLHLVDFILKPQGWTYREMTEVDVILKYLL